MLWDKGCEWGMSMQNIGNLIYDVREKKGMTRSELAEGICSKKYIYMIENGERSPSIQILMGISKKLHFNFFDTISYLSNEEPLKLKELISTFIRLRTHDNSKKIIEYAQSIKKMTLFMRSDVKQLVLFHDIYLRMINDLTSSEDIDLAKDLLDETCEYTQYELDMAITISYTELLLLSIIEICKFKYYNEFNIPRLEHLYELSKSIIRKDESIDSALIILRTLFEAYDRFKLTDKKQKVKADFRRTHLDNLESSMGCIDLLTLKTLISSNVDIFADQTIVGEDEYGQKYFTMHLLKPNNVVYIPRGDHPEVFGKGQLLAYARLKDLLPAETPYNLIADFNEFMLDCKSIDYYQLADPQEIYDFRKDWEIRLASYYVMSKLNTTALEILVYQNRISGLDPNYHPITVDTTFDALAAILGSDLSEV